MQNPTIAQINRELNGIDQLIDAAVKDRNVDEATRLQVRKQMLPRILGGMTENAKEIECKIESLKKQRAEAQRDFELLENRRLEIEEKKLELHKQLQSMIEPHAQAKSKARVIQDAHDKAVQELAEIRGVWQ